MRRSRHLALAAALGLALTVAGTTSAAQAASTASTPHSHGVVPKSHPFGAEQLVYGKKKDGSTFGYTTTVGAAQPAAAPTAAAVSGSCTVTIWNLVLDGSSHNFEWDTDQICSGDYGKQALSTQMWRSSWSGWRDFDGEATTSLTSDYYISEVWDEPCSWGGGTYDYVATVYGFTTGWGSGPLTLSNQLDSKPCGTSS